MPVRTTSALLVASTVTALLLATGWSLLGHSQVGRLCWTGQGVSTDANGAPLVCVDGNRWSTPHRD